MEITARYAATITDASVTGPAIGTASFWEAKVILLVGAVGGEAEFQVTIEESADGDTWTAIAGADFGPMGPDEVDSVHVGEVLLGGDRGPYLRACSTVSGGSAEHSVIFILSRGATNAETPEFRV